MSLVAVGVFSLFGLASVAGGVLGFRRAGSRASLIFGGGSGVVLLGAAAALLAGATGLGLSLGGGISLLLGARFVPAFVRTKKWMPQGMMAGFSCLGMAATALGYLG